MNPAYSLSVRVMCHPFREPLARVLASELKGLDAQVSVDPTPDDGSGALSGAINAWRCMDPRASHCVVLQDDVAITNHFAVQLRDLVAANPLDPIALFADWSSRNGAVCRYAYAVGARLTTAVPEFIPSLGLVMPVDSAHAFVAFADQFRRDKPDERVADDDLLRLFFHEAGLRLRLAVPSVVDHRTAASLVGNEVQGRRAAALFTSTLPPRWFAKAPQSLDLQASFPYFHKGHLEVYKRPIQPPFGTERLNWEKFTGIAGLAELGLCDDSIWSEFVRTMMSGRMLRLFDDLDAEAIWSAWVSGFSLAMSGRWFGLDGVTCVWCKNVGGQVSPMPLSSVLLRMVLGGIAQSRVAQNDRAAVAGLRSISGVGYKEGCRWMTQC